MSTEPDATGPQPEAVEPDPATLWWRPRRTLGWLAICMAVVPYATFPLMMFPMRVFLQFGIAGKVIAVAFPVLMGLVLAVSPLIAFRVIVRNRSSQPGADEVEWWRGAVAFGIFMASVFIPNPLMVAMIPARMIEDPSILGRMFRVPGSPDPAIDNLRALHSEFVNYARGNEGRRLPALSAEPGRLMHGADEPGWTREKFLTENHPRYKETLRQLQDNPATTLDDWSYFYLGYVVRSDIQMAEFVKIYKQRKGTPGAFDGDIAATMFPDGLMKRLSLAVAAPPPEMNRPPYPHETDLSGIPLLIGRPEHNRNRGAWVLYLDGHVEHLDYGERWPMTEKTVALLRELDELGGNEEGS